MKQAGFTLIELVVMVIITGILAVAAYSFWPSTTSAISLRSASNQLVSDIRYVQYEAMTKRNAYRINFSTGTSSYNLTAADGTTPLLHPALASNTVALPSGVSMTLTNLPNNYLEFNRRGEPFIFFFPFSLSQLAIYVVKIQRTI